MSVFFNGRLLVTPTVASRIDDTEMANKNLTVPMNLAIIGQADSGQPQYVYEFGTPTEAEETLQGGELLIAIKKAFAPSTETYGPQTIYAIRVDPATQAHLVVPENDYSATTGACQAATASTITLASGASGSNDAYNDYYIKMTSGAANGETNLITDYVGSSKEATLRYSWRNTPSPSDTYEIAPASICFDSTDYGVNANRVKVQIAAGTTSGKKLSTAFGSDTVYEDNLAADYLTLQYTGSAASCIIDVTGTQILVKAGTGGAESTIYTIALEDYPTVDELVDYLDSKADLAAVAGPTYGEKATELSLDYITGQSMKGYGCTLEISTIDGGTGAITALASAPTAAGTGYAVGDILTITTGGTGGTATVATIGASGAVATVTLTTAGTGYTTGAGKATNATTCVARNITADLQAIIDWAETVAEPWIDVYRPALAGTVPDDISWTFLMGGTATSPTTTDWDDALELLETEEVQCIVPLTSTAAIHAAADTHCIFMSNQGEMERRCIVGGALGETADQVIARAYALNSDRTYLVTPGYKDYDASSVLTTYAPYMLAALLGGMICGSDPGTSLTNKTITVRGLETAYRKPTDTDDLINGGVICCIATKTGYKVAQSVSTWLTNLNYNRREMGTGFAVDYVARNVREALAPLIGKKATPSILAEAISRTENCLKELARPAPAGPGVIVGDEASPAYKNITATLEADILRCYFTCSPCVPCNFVLISIGIKPYSGTASQTSTQ